VKAKSLKLKAFCFGLLALSFLSNNIPSKPLSLNQKQKL